jgi:hypothetical protein
VDRKLKKEKVYLQDGNKHGQASMNFDLQQKLPAVTDFTETER